MARINWKKHYKTLTESLHEGATVQETAEKIGVSYSTLCKFLREVSLDKYGHFKKPIRNTPTLEAYFTNYVLKEHDQLQDICNLFQASSSQIENLMKTYTLTKAWAFQDSTSENIAYGRAAELFIKEQDEFRIIADMIKKDSKSEYDLVVAPNQELFKHWHNIEKIGAVDVKATKLRKMASGGYRHKFNVANVTKPTKYVFAVGYTEDYEEPMILLLLPFKEIKGKQSISISVDKLEESKWAEWVFKIYPSKQQSLYSETMRTKYNLI